MLDAVYNKSVMSQAGACHWYEFKSSRKKAELMGRPDAPKTMLTE